jgi:DnaJ-domain-containing protein 1
MPADRAETIRRIASQALLDQYTRFGKKVRDQIQDGVLMVEHRPSVGRISSLERQVATPFARELAILRQRLEIAIARAEARRR